MTGALTWRAGRAIDAPALVGIVTLRQRQTRFAGVCDVDELHARKLFAVAAQRHGGTNEGATWLQVAESARGIEAFILGTLARVYLVGRKLVAQDVFLLGCDDSDPRTILPLVRSYIGWAQDNPRVVEINLSWSDALPGAERFAALYEREGFVRCGGTFRRFKGRETMKEAA